MIPNPIVKVLSTFRRCEVRSLLMGGQACILYGAAEFSRDTDFAVLLSEENLARLKAALQGLSAEPIFYPPLSEEHLRRGHACHFRCGAPEARGLRIDLMAVLRGCDPFDLLWTRREVVDLPGLPAVPILSLPDLVRAKKTQRDKDWPMIRRLVEADYLRHMGSPTEDRLRFWIRESRTPDHLFEIARAYPSLVDGALVDRQLLAHAKSGNREGLEKALLEEQERERALDREYWRPLREELEAFRRMKGR